MVNIVEKAKWVWLPHPAHFICANGCQFRLATYVGKYIVSTVGEYVPPAEIMKIMHPDLADKKGNELEFAFLKKYDYEEIGCDRKYETMVFKAIKSEFVCCPYAIDVSQEVDFKGYNIADEATKGHMKLCEKWSKK